MEETSNFTKIDTYSLSIRFSSDGFSLLVDDVAGYRVSSKTVSAPVFSLTNDRIVSLIQKEAAGLLNCERVRILCESDKYAFVPNALFELNNKQDYLLFEHSLDKKERVIVNQIDNWETVNVFAIPINLSDALTQLFANVTVEHYLSFFLTDKVIRNSDPTVNIWVRPKQMDAVVVVNANLQLINSFAYHTEEDFTYFTLNIFEQLNLDTERCGVRLYNVDTHSELCKMIKTYVKQVEVFS